MQPDAATRLFCVLGNPVGHSLSPAMHNPALAHAGIDAVYLAFEVKDIGAAMIAVRALSISGASVTIPHKVAIMDHIDEIDETALAIGAVNTVVNRGGRLFGTNTDGLGAARALWEKTRVSGKPVLVLGSGGAARAVGHAVAREGAKVVLAHRPEDDREAAVLADRLGCGRVTLGEAPGVAADVLVNTTPVGMAPRVDAVPVDPKILKPPLVVMDVVYNPLTTRLLSLAREAGCETVCGVEMFIFQGAAQFSLWNGVEAPVDVMRRAVMARLDPKFDETKDS